MLWVVNSTDVERERDLSFVEFSERSKLVSFVDTYVT